jgi:hypothetical protein
MATKKSKKSKPKKAKVVKKSKPKKAAPKKVKAKKTVAKKTTAKKKQTRKPLAKPKAPVIATQPSLGGGLLDSSTDSDGKGPGDSPRKTTEGAGDSTR